MADRVLNDSLLGFCQPASEGESINPSTAPSESADKKKKRRAGRKHKNHSKQVSDLSTKSDKEKIRFKTEMRKNW